MEKTLYLATLAVVASCAHAPEKPNDQSIYTIQREASGNAADQIIEDEAAPKSLESIKKDLRDSLSDIVRADLVKKLDKKRQELIQLASFRSTRTPFTAEAPKNWKADDDEAVADYFGARGSLMETHLIRLKDLYRKYEKGDISRGQFDDEYYKLFEEYEAAIKEEATSLAERLAVNRGRYMPIFQRGL